MRHQRWDMHAAHGGIIDARSDDGDLLDGETGEWVKAKDYDELVARLEAAEKERDELRILVALAAHQ